MHPVRPQPPDTDVRPRAEGGAIIVYYALLLVVMLGMAAVVLDLAALRYDRRLSQTAADMAAVAGAMSLHAQFEGSPREACEDAWGYFLANTPQTPGSAPNPCGSTFPEGAACSPNTPRTATGEVGPYEVRITWPVPDGSPLLQGRSEGEVDGHPCERIAIEVERLRAFLFAPVMDFTEGSTTAPAVGRAFALGEQGEVVSLVVLDRTNCQAMLAKGQAKIWVKAADHTDPDTGEELVWGTPGIITIDSDGSGSCNAAPRYTLETEGNQNSEIKAGVDDEGNVVNGDILSYALTAGNIGQAFNGSSVDSGRLAPRPIAAHRRITRAPVDHRYNCKQSYEDDTRVRDPIEGCAEWASTEPHIDRLRSRVGATGAPAGFQDYVDWMATNHPDIGNPCHLQSTAGRVEVPAGDWWVGCSSLIISNELAFEDGDVVVDGTIDLRSAGAIIVNENRSQDAFLYLRSGDLKKTAQATLRLNRTAVYIHDGIMDLGGGDQHGTLFWEAPHAGTFEDLALWSESSAAHALSGQGTLFLEGAYFAPNATPFEFKGQGDQEQTKAQFISHRIWASGQGKLIMTPDPDRAVMIPVLGVNLIR